MKNNVSILIAGDFCPHKRIEQIFLRKEYKNIYNEFENMSQNGDLSITNLECPITLSNNPKIKTGPNLKAHPDCIQGIKYGGFNVVTLANNHIMDYGEQGLNDTINVCEKNDINYVGVGKNVDEASKPLYITIKETKIAIVNFCENEWSIASKNSPGANSLNLVKNYYQIKEAKNKSDFVLVIIHGEHEQYEYPSSIMVETYRFLADCGANAIIGHHTHCPSGYEVYNDTPIFYSLGNFIFDWENRNESWYQGFFITFDINQNNKLNNLSLHPYYQCKIEPKIEILEREKKDVFINQIEKISKQIQDRNYLKEQFDKLCNEKKVMYLSNLLSLNKFKRQLIKNNKLAELLINKDSLRKMLNIIRCESHRDCLINILEDFLNR